MTLPSLNLSPCMYRHCYFTHAPLIGDGGPGRTLPGHKVRMCHECEVTWYGPYGTRCWVCGFSGRTYWEQDTVAA